MLRLRILFSVLIILLSPVSSAKVITPHDRFACGISHVEIFNSKDLKQPFFTVKISNPKSSVKLKYSVRNEILLARCDTTSSSIPVVLIQHYCSGTGCAYSFGIIDPKSLQVLLAPSQSMEGNGLEAEKILGHKIKPFSCKTLSKTSHGSNGKGEYCYVSPIELG